MKTNETPTPKEAITSGLTVGTTETETPKPVAEVTPAVVAPVEEVITETPKPVAEVTPAVVAPVEEGTSTSEDEEDDNEEKDPDVHDDEPIKNMGQLRKVKNSNKNLSRRLKESQTETETLRKEYEEYKEKVGDAASPSILEELKTLREKVAEYTDKEVEAVKKAALVEAGLPEAYLVALTGDEEDWKKTLAVLAENLPHSRTRLTSDSVTNGLTSKYKGSNVQTMEQKTKNVLELLRNPKH